MTPLQERRRNAESAARWRGGKLAAILTNPRAMPGVYEPSVYYTAREAAREGLFALGRRKPDPFDFAGMVRA